MTRCNVMVLTTGGTIASKPSGTGLNISGALNGQSLLEQIDLPGSVNVEVRSVLQKSSNAVSFEDLVKLQRLCQALADDPSIDGIVVTHGTDTLEEAVHFLDITLLLESCALVITGSQRAPHESGTDALRNLTDAITVAAAPEMRGLGAVVVFNESIYAARHVRKISTYQVDGFGSPGYGKLGYIDGERVFLGQSPRRATHIALGEALPRVDILPAYLGASSALIPAAIDSGARGLVIEGLGRGHVPPEWLDHIVSAAGAGVPVVVVSSCPVGPVNTRYEFPGSLASLEACGAIAIRDLSAKKARLSLSVLLSTDGTEDMERRLQLITRLNPVSRT